MSNSLAIAAVTSTLRNMLSKGLNEVLAGAQVTTKPPDKARNTSGGDQVNLYLYQTSPNGAWRNADLPGQVNPGEVGQPPLALVLHYLLTAYTDNDDELRAHQLLGRAMGVLHDRPVLSRDDLRLSVPGSDVHDQPERIRVTAAPLTLEEMSKLWTTFQTQYRISAAYEASVVLIESSAAVQSGLPVARRGSRDEGVTAHGSTVSPFPSLRAASVPGSHPAALPGEEVVFSGTSLAGGGVVMRLAHPRLDEPVDVPVADLARVTPTSIAFSFPDQPAQLPAGVYTVQAVVTGDDGVERTSNEFPLAVAPVLSNLPSSVARDDQGDITLGIDVRPLVAPSQRVALLLGSRQVPVPSPMAATGHLDVAVRAVAPGDSFVRLRVDGVDSRLVDPAADPPALDATRRVTVT